MILNNEGYGQEIIILQLRGCIKAFRGETLGYQTRESEEKSAKNCCEACAAACRAEGDRLWENHLQPHRV